MSQHEIEILITKAIAEHESKFTAHAIVISILYFALAAAIAWYL